jgi:hypothetical protein
MRERVGFKKNLAPRRQIVKNRWKGLPAPGKPRRPGLSPKSKERSHEIAQSNYLQGLSQSNSLMEKMELLLAAVKTKCIGIDRTGYLENRQYADKLTGIMLNEDGDGR